MAKARRAAARLNVELSQNRAKLSAVLSSGLPDITPGPCESGASLACTGIGSTRLLPESMLPGSEPEYMQQCDPCYDYSAERYVRVRHAQKQEEAKA